MARQDLGFACDAEALLERLVRCQTTLWLLVPWNGFSTVKGPTHDRLSQIETMWLLFSALVCHWILFFARTCYFLTPR